MDPQGKRTIFVLTKVDLAEENLTKPDRVRSKLCLNYRVTVVIQVIFHLDSQNLVWETVSDASSRIFCGCDGTRKQR
jgi:hypothetical protein